MSMSFNFTEFFNAKPVLLAPMAGVSDEAFRTLCKEQGADLTYTEMVSAKGLSYANEKTRHLLDLADGEEVVAVQLFGHEPDVMAAQAVWVEEALGNSLAYLDINMGCPARKIVGKGDGSALMKSPDLAAQIVSAVKKRVKHPVTVKFRRGWSEDQETAPEFAQRMEAAGADMMVVHGRSAEQLYRGKADWDVIKKTKETVSVPVIGNGDVVDASSALKLIEQTDCDGVMIARAAEGNPWVFAQVKAALRGTAIPTLPTAYERIGMARRHAELLTHRSGNNIVRMRKHAMWYMSGLPGASAAREKFNYCVTFEDFNRVFNELEEKLYEMKEA